MDRLKIYFWGRGQIENIYFGVVDRLKIYFFGAVDRLKIYFFISDTDRGHIHCEVSTRIHQTIRDDIESSDPGDSKTSKMSFRSRVGKKVMPVCGQITDIFLGPWTD